MRLVFLAAALQAAGAVNAGMAEGLCSTKLGVSLVQNVPRSTKTIGLPLTAYVQYCASTTKTITPKAATTTLTDTSTSTIVETAEQLTDTVETTSTGNLVLSPLPFLNREADSDQDYTTNTVLFSTTIATTSTATSTTTSTGTLTIPTPAGFTPIASDVTYVAKKRDIPERFSLQRANSKFVQSRTVGSGKKSSYFPAVHPQAVNCIKFQKDVTTKTIKVPFCTKTKTTTLAPSTATVRELISTATTRTEDQPPAVVISTIRTTVTVETSSTSTHINTVTSTGNSYSPKLTQSLY